MGSERGQTGAAMNQPKGNGVNGGEMCGVRWGEEMVKFAINDCHYVMIILIITVTVIM